MTGPGVATERYFEDFAVGETVEIGRHRITADEIVGFAHQYDPQPFHTDPVKARDSIYNGLIASGWQTCAIVMRVMCDAYLLRAASMGSPGMEEIRWLKPVRPDDTLIVKRTIEEARPTSKADRGLVLTRWDVYNQRDEHVMMMRGYGLFGRRGADA
ncbi:MAG: MaoC family dehydratase [Burkholderiales bacterium]|nr:MaoC family dehydratase [Burkholderiales bacterium]